MLRPNGLAAKTAWLHALVLALTMQGTSMALAQTQGAAQSAAGSVRLNAAMLREQARLQGQIRLIVGLDDTVVADAELAAPAAARSEPGSPPASGRC